MPPGQITTGVEQLMPAGRLVLDVGRLAVSTTRTSVRFAVGTVSLPVEVTTKTLNILRLTEELLEESVYLMRAARPVVDGVSSAYRAGHCRPVFRTIGHIQQSAQVIAFVWTPVEVVRGVIVSDRAPTPAVQVITAGEPARGPQGGLSAPVASALVAPALVAPALVLGSRVVQQAAALPGVRLATGPLRRIIGDRDHAAAAQALIETAAVPLGTAGPELRIPALRLSLPSMHLRTPNLRLPSVGVTVPRIALRTPGLSVKLPGPGAAASAVRALAGSAA